VRHLLLLYSLHPEDLETRVLKALDGAAPKLRKQNSEAELVSIREGAVQVRIRTLRSRLWIDRQDCEGAC
jgi:hypothetical protein